MGESERANVYKGNYKGKFVIFIIIYVIILTQVAIKVLKESLDGKHQEDFNKELEVIRLKIFLRIFSYFFT